MISAAMIVKNEARCVLRCLSSIVPAVDEIVIADTGSTDDTKAIIARFAATSPVPVRLYDYEWRDDFADARNFTLSQTEGDWLFAPDADEWLRDGEAAKIRRMVEQLGSSKAIVAFQFHHLSHGSVFEVSHGLDIRMFSSGFMYRDSIHEQLNTSLVERFQIVHSDIVLFHDGYDGAAAEQRLAKHRRNVAMLEAAIQREPENPKYYYFFAKEISSLMPDVAMQFLNEAKHLNESHPDPNPLLRESIQELSTQILAK